MNGEPQGTEHVHVAVSEEAQVVVRQIERDGIETPIDLVSQVRQDLFAVRFVANPQNAPHEGVEKHIPGSVANETIVIQSPNDETVYIWTVDTTKKASKQRSRAIAFQSGKFYTMTRKGKHVEIEQDEEGARQVSGMLSVLQRAAYV